MNWVWTFPHPFLQQISTRISSRHLLFPTHAHHVAAALHRRRRARQQHQRKGYTTRAALKRRSRAHSPATANSYRHTTAQVSAFHLRLSPLTCAAQLILTPFAPDHYARIKGGHHRSTTNVKSGFGQGMRKFMQESPVYCSSKSRKRVCVSLFAASIVRWTQNSHTNPTHSKMLSRSAARKKGHATAQTGGADYLSS